jgi:hypothetical protein
MTRCALRANGPKPDAPPQATRLVRGVRGCARRMVVPYLQKPAIVVDTRQRQTHCEVGAQSHGPLEKRQPGYRRGGKYHAFDIARSQKPGDLETASGCRKHPEAYVHRNGDASMNDPIVTPCPTRCWG